MHHPGLHSGSARRNRPSSPHRQIIAAISRAIALLLFVAAPANAHLSIIRQGGEAAGPLATDNSFGSALAVGDFNGDGFDDLATGAPNEKVGLEINAGAVIVSFGSSHGITHVGSLEITAGAAGGVARLGAWFGSSLLSADFDQDGYADLAIGAPFERVSGVDNAGRIYIMYGAASGFRAAAASFTQALVGGTIEETDFFGYSLGSGDWNLDSYPDLAVGAPGDGGSGAVSINLMGGPSGVTSTNASTIRQSALGGTNGYGDNFGWSLAGGNVFGSSNDDLVIGVPEDSEPFGFSAAGRIVMMIGSPTGLTTVASASYDASSVDGAVPGARFGWAVAIGRFFNSPGYSSLAIGEPLRNVGSVVGAGRIMAVKGSHAGLDFSGTNCRVLTQNSGGGTAQANDHFGLVLAAGDYYDGDGYDDIAIGTPNDGLGVGASNAGQVQIYPGAFSGPTGVGWSAFAQNACNDPIESGDNFGYAIAYGRFDATNKGGFAVGAPGEDVEGAYDSPNATIQNAGQVHIFAPWRQVLGMTSHTAVMGDCGGELMFTVRPFDRVYVASTTKIMTILLASEHVQAGLSLTTPYVVPSWVTDNSLIGGSECQPPLVTGEYLTLRDLMYMSLRFSGNDAAFAIADLVGGGGSGATTFAGFKSNVQSFVNEMNARAASLGMSGTHFTNPPGYDWDHPWLGTGNDHRSTAYDMWLLGKVAIVNPLFASVCGTSPYATLRFGQAYIVDYDYAKAFGDPDVIGLKDGYTLKAQTTAVFAANFGGSASTNVVGSLFGTPTNLAHFTEPTSMMNIALPTCGLTSVSVKYLVPVFRYVTANLSTLAGAMTAGSGPCTASAPPRVQCDVFNQDGAGAVSLRLELGYTAPVTLEARGRASFGIGPFQSHHGIELSSLDDSTHVVRVTLSTGGDPIVLTIAPGRPVLLPAASNPSSSFTATIENLDVGSSPLQVDVVYAYDLSGIRAAATAPGFTAMLDRATDADDAIWFQTTGRDPAPGGTVFLGLHDPTIALDVDDPSLPTHAVELRASPAAPNPFRDRIGVRFELGVAASVGLEVMDLQGRLVRRLPERSMPAGRASLEWDGASDDGAPQRNGVYFYRLTRNGRPEANGRMVLMR